MTPEQYLEIERSAEYRSEYYRGQMYATAGGAESHALIVGNFQAELRAALRKRPCRVYASELRLRTSLSGLYTYPDVMVVCDKPEFTDKRRDTLTNSVMIAEVLSDSTEAYDRGLKFEQYRKIAALQEYVLVSQKEPRVEVFRRLPSGTWEFRQYVGMECSCELTSLGCGIALADIYDKVTLGEPSTPPSVE